MLHSSTAKSVPSGAVSCPPPHTRPNGLCNFHMKGSSPCEQHLDLAEAISQAPWFPTRCGAPGGVGGLPDVCPCPCLLAGAHITGHRLPLSYPLHGLQQQPSPYETCSPEKQMSPAKRPGWVGRRGRRDPALDLWWMEGPSVRQADKRGQFLSRRGTDNNKPKRRQVDLCCR